MIVSKFGSVCGRIYPLLDVLEVLCVIYGLSSCRLDRGLPVMEVMSCDEL